jgi:hypothetical protein
MLQKNPKMSNHNDRYDTRYSPPSSPKRDKIAPRTIRMNPVHECLENEFIISNLFL